MPDKKSKVQPKTKKLEVSKNGEQKKLSVKSLESKVKAEAKIIVSDKDELALGFYSTKGKIEETIKLSKEIFGAKINNVLMAQAVRVYLANQREGSASTKTRGEVHGTTKKVWQQKGTGRARHGSKKAPIFVHGGIAFGPHPKDFSLRLSKKMKRLALFSALSSKMKKGEIKGIVGFEKIEPKTKLMAEAIRNLGIKNNKISVVIPSVKAGFENFYRATRNIRDVKIISANILNVYEVLNSKIILLAKDSLKAMEDVFLNRKEAKNG